MPHHSLLFGVFQGRHPNAHQPSDAAAKVVDKPDALERWLLAAQLSELHDSLRPGLTHLNWHSLGIQDFVNPVLKVLHMQEFCPQSLFCFLTP